MRISILKKIHCSVSRWRSSYFVVVLIGLAFRSTILNYPLPIRNDHVLLAVQQNGEIQPEEFPFTKFTPHVNELVASLSNKTNFSDCLNEYHIFVNGSSSHAPKVYGYMNLGKTTLIENEWTKLIERIFLSRTIPNSVRFGTTWGDYNHPDRLCIGSSSANGNMTMTNFLILKDQARSMSGNESKYVDKIPWKNREKVPIFRGTAWGLTDCKSKSYQEFTDESSRLMAVDFSVDHPHLLNAGLTSRSFNAPCWKYNSTNGLSKLLFNKDDIPPEQYYTQYQVALVLGGIGAAFRTSHHLSTGTAVVLQDWHYREWFTDLLIPWKHYIPLDMNLSNLEERMNWIQRNNEKVEIIAREGQKFYDRYLSFSSNEDHIHEFLYRLSIQQSAVKNEKNLQAS